MKRSVTLTLLAASLGLFTIAAAPQPVHSAIHCDGEYQIVKGVGAIATPYCEDKLLADLARKSGVKTSAEAVRNNFAAKQEACTVVSDIRVNAACDIVLGSDG